MFNGKLNQFCIDTNKSIRKKGFWDDMDDALCSIQNTKGFLCSDVLNATKDAFIAQKVALIMSESSEALEAMRKDNYGIEKKDTFEDELADVFIRLSDLCGELNIDIEKQIVWKMSFNKIREEKHGKKF